MFRYFKLSPSNVNNKFFGNVFKCNKVDGTKLLCGMSDKCSNCDLRNGVGSVIKTGRSLDDVILKHDFIIEGINETKWFKVSASLVTIKELKYAVVSFSDITRQKQYEELLKLKLSLDMQTGTLNKYSLIEVLQNLVSEKNILKKITISMVDFDDFKHINDTYGHLKGDKILEGFSSISFKNIRKSDILGRYGGEEFIFIFYETSLNKSLNILKRIYNDFKNFCIKEVGEPLSFSSGIFEMEGSELKKMKKNDIINSVDKYLYEAKRRGKKRIVSDHIEIILK
jgi:diguanylate cyclase (GGDEF)-like protein